MDTMTNVIKKLWAMLPYPITHLGQCMNEAPEWHNFVIGMGAPAYKMWRIKLDIEINKAESHYFVAGVLISTVALLMSIGAFIVLIIKIT